MNKLLTLLLWIVLILSALNILKAINYSTYPDFTVYFQSARDAFDGKNPYITQGYAYPPISLILFLALTPFGLILAGKIWFFISIFLCFLSIYLLFTMYLKKTNFKIKLFLLVLIFNFFPFKFSLGMGQLNSLPLFFLSLFLYFYENNRKRSAVFISLSMWSKFFPTLIIPFFILRKQWKIILYLLLFSIILFILGFLVLRPEYNFYFLKVIIPGLISGEKIDYYNQALSGFLIRNLYPFHQALLKVIQLFALSFTAIFLIRYSNRFFRLEYSLIIILSLILAPYAWQHHFLLLIIPMIILFSEALKKKHRTIFLLLLFIAYLFSALNIKAPNNFNPLLLSHLLYGSLILLVLNFYFLLKPKIKS